MPSPHVWVVVGSGKGEGEGGSGVGTYTGLVPTVNEPFKPEQGPPVWRGEREGGREPSAVLLSPYPPTADIIVFILTFVGLCLQLHSC